jgi:signal transduction histidine kinase
MMRNGELRLLLIVLVLTTAAGTGFVYVIAPVAGVAVLISGLVLTGVALGFTFWRYRQLARLSADLRSIAAGDYSLDIRDNREGELSILKNNIYKVTLMLSEQAELLKRDKTYLADALSDISHQLRTPLTSMGVMTDLLLDPSLKEEKRTDFLRSIRSQLERTRWLVSSLLKLSKIDAGAVHFKVEQHELHRLIQQAAEPLLIPMELKEQTFVISCPPHLLFTGDFNWTAEAVLNMLKNAMEHTDQGGTLSVTGTANPLYTELVIADNGHGIDPVDLPHIFERFYKGQSSGEDSIGIGLAMAKAILGRQNAEIVVDSKIGEGTRFIIKFYQPIRREQPLRHKRKQELSD